MFKLTFSNVVEPSDGPVLFTSVTRYMCDYHLPQALKKDRSDSAYDFNITILDDPDVCCDVCNGENTLL